MAGSPRARGSLVGRAAAPAPEEAERRRLHVGRAARDLWRAATGAPGELEAANAGLRAAPGTPTVRKRAPKDPSAPRARPRRTRRARAPGAGGGRLPGRAEVRQGSSRCGDTAGPRAGLTAATEASTGGGWRPEPRGGAGRRAGSVAHSNGRTVAATSAASDRGRFVVTSRREGEGAGRLRGPARRDLGARVTCHSAGQ